MALVFEVQRAIPFVFSLWVSTLLLLPKGAMASQPMSQLLEQKRIHALYNEGDFEAVIAAIDSFTQTNQIYNQSDSIFIAKHLAVVYTANPATREKGKNYMFQLFNLVPFAKIVDMFVSDEIDHIFEKVREEYLVRQQDLGLPIPTRLESSQYAAEKMIMKENDGSNAESADTTKRKPGKSHVLYWAAGGATLVAISGVTLYLLQPKKPTDIAYDVPK